MTPTTAHYKSVLESASREDALLTLYQGAILRLKKAQQSWYIDPNGQAWDMVNQAMAIITELDNMLDRENGEPNIVAELNALYKFMIREMNVAVLRLDSERIQSILDILETLYAGWQDAAKESKQASRPKSLMTTAMEV